MQAACGVTSWIRICYGIDKKHHPNKEDKKMKRTNLNNLFLFFGSFIILTVGLLVAFVPGLAYATVHSYFLDIPNPPFGLPYVQYQSLDFSTHIYTIRFLVSAIGGLIGLFALLGKNRKAYLGVTAIGIAIMGLMFPATGDMRISFPEMRLSDAPWIAAFIITVGICLMFIGLTIKKEHVPKASFLSLPLLLAVYSIPPILIMFNYLPWIVFGAVSFNPISLLIWFIPFASFLLMAWGALSSRWQEITRFFRD